MPFGYSVYELQLRFEQMIACDRAAASSETSPDNTRTLLTAAGSFTTRQPLQSLSGSV